MSKPHDNNNLQNQGENVPRDIPLTLRIEPFPPEFAAQLDEAIAATEAALHAASQKGVEAALGAEPYWMQDVRIAQRKIDAARRAAQSSGPSGEFRSESEDL
jgi:hypothetical protein